MDTRDALIFKNLVLTGSISEVSRRMNLSQSTVSYRLKQLEKELGAVLYEYNGTCRITEEGRDFFRYCCTMTRHYDELKDRLRHKQPLQIALSTASSFRYLESIYSVCSRMGVFPVIKTTICDATAHELLAGGALFCIVEEVDPVMKKSIRVVTLREEKVVLVYNRLLEEDIEKIPLILDEKRSGLHKDALEYLKGFRGCEVVAHMGIVPEKFAIAQQHQIGFFSPEYIAREYIGPALALSEKYFFFRKLQLLFDEENENNAILKAVLEKID